MNPRDYKRRIKIFAAIELLLVLMLSTLGAAWFFRIRGPRDVMAYVGMQMECSPVWKDLAFRRIYVGQDVEEVIKATNPKYVERHGAYVDLTYQSGFTGLGIMAKNGRLVYAAAGSCTWGHEFFNELTTEDWKAYYDAYDEHWKPIRKQREEEQQRATREDGK